LDTISPINKILQTRDLTAPLQERKVLLAMTCSKCGASNPVVHLSGTIDGVSDKRAYCKACFALSEFTDETVMERIGLYESQQVKAELEKNLQQLTTVFGPKLDELAERDHRFPREAYDFIFQSLKYAMIMDASPPPSRSRHVTARQLVEACESFANETYGASAKSQLKSWGIETSSNVGDLVFLLVENGLFGKREDDQRSDFNHLPFLADKT
jgi:uncharacterized repeat protein (TIGR04138 family)